VAIVDRCNSQEHENNCFRGAAQHFQGIFYGCMGFVRYIGLHIIFHGYTTKSYSVKCSEQKLNALQFACLIAKTYAKIPLQWNISAFK
jgi:predicted tellurium resistance membrane protein TerC